jgi:hypothetical protein
MADQELIEKNKKLKEQLQKERLTSTRKGKGLDEILAHQKVRAPKQGLRQAPKRQILCKKGTKSMAMPRRML